MLGKFKNIFSSANTENANKLILVVEDNEVDLRLISKILTNEKNNNLFEHYHNSYIDKLVSYIHKQRKQ